MTGPAVMTSVMPAMRMAASVAARPAVKLRLTGTLPASMSGGIGDDGGAPGGQDDGDAAAGARLRR